VVARYEHPFGTTAAQARTALSVITLAEIRFGIELIVDANRRAELNAARAQGSPDVSWACVTGNRRYSAQMAASGGGRAQNRHTFSQPDLLIAATAIYHGLTVVTRDRHEYDAAGAAVFNHWTA